MKIAVQFGAGNIGRGFMGQFFFESGYKTIFVEAREELVELLNRKRCYPLRILDAYRKKSFLLKIENIEAVSSDDTGRIADIISGHKLVGPPLSNSVSPSTDYKRRGHNLYFPIPYSKHCKITYETKVPIDRGGKKGEALYYQINYRTYEKGAVVESLSDKVLSRAKGVLGDVQGKIAG